MKTAKALPCPKITPGQKKLTSKQEAYARQFAQERIAAMLSTAAIDEAEAEKHLRNGYQVGGIKPVPVRWFDSPVPFVVAEIGNHLGGGVGDLLWNKLWSRAESEMWCSVLPKIRKGIPWYKRIRNSVWWRGSNGGIRGNIEESIQGRVRDRVGRTATYGIERSFWDSFGEYVWASNPDPYRELGDRSALGVRIFQSVRMSVKAYEDEVMRSVDRFLHEVFEANPLIHLALFNEMVSGFLLGSKEAWLVRKPIHLSLDEQGRLHSENGMCMQYRDGWGFYAWHGVCVRAQGILHPERLTREEWANERNVEARRIIQERLDPERFIALVGGTSLDRSQCGELIAVDLKDDPERVAHYIHVQDSSTERQYYLRVPPTIQSANEAVAWTFGLSGQEYQPEQET